MLKYFICYLLFRIFYIIILPLFDKNYKKYGTIDRVVSRMLPESIANPHLHILDHIPTLTTSFYWKMRRIPLLSVSPFLKYVIMHLSEVRYSSEHIYFYQSQVVIELVAHFSWTWFCFLQRVIRSEFNGTWHLVSLLLFITIIPKYSFITYIWISIPK